MPARQFLLTAATAAWLGLMVCTLALSGSAAEEKAAAKDDKKKKDDKKDDAKKADKKGDDAKKAEEKAAAPEPVHVAYLDVPEPVRKAAMSETGSGRTFAKIKTDDGMDAFLITYKRFGRSFEMTVGMDGNILKKDDTTPPEPKPEPKPEPPEPKPDPKTKTVTKTVTKPATKPATKPETTEVAKTAPVPKGAVSYSKTIVPILARACYSCHDVNKRKADLDLKTSYNTAMESVKAGQPDNSLLYNSLIGAKGVQKMPKGGKALSPDEIAAVKAWIAAGAKDN